MLATHGISQNKVKIGYEISFNRYFYKPEAGCGRWRKSALTS